MGAGAAEGMMQSVADSYPLSLDFFSFYGILARVYGKADDQYRSLAA